MKPGVAARTIIFATAIFVWLALVSNTIGLAQRASAPPLLRTATPLPPTATTVPTPTRLPAARLDPLGPTPTTSALVAAAGDDAPRFSGHPKTGRLIAAWLPDSFGSENRRSFDTNADILDEVSPFWYAPSPSGDLYHDREARDATLLALAKEKHVLVIPTVHNVVLGEDPVPGILSSPSRRQHHINAIVREVKTYGYDGIDVDYEFLSSSLRDEYTAFIVGLGAALHADGKLLSIAVHAKNCDRCGLGSYQDWAALGEVVDRLRIMTYDYHWRGGGPGPVSPVYWIESVGTYAKSVVDPSKVVIGVPFYGYNWPASGGTALGQTWQMIADIIDANKLPVNLMERDSRGEVQENWITYSSRDGGRRTIWFATASGLDAKLQLVQRLDLAGIAIWRLGGEDPRNWEVIRSRLVSDPFESQRMINRVLPEH